MIIIIIIMIITIVAIAADAGFVFTSSGMVYNILFKRFLPGGIILFWIAFGPFPCCFNQLRKTAILSVIFPAYQICTNPWQFVWDNFARHIDILKLSHCIKSLGTYSNFFIKHCVKSVCIRSYSRPYFPAFGLNMERYGVSLCIQSECRIIRTRITPNTHTFHAAIVMNLVRIHACNKA